MIKLIICGEDFEQEVKVLIKSFYPEDALMCIKGEGRELLQAETDKDVLFMELNLKWFELILIMKNQERVTEKEDFPDFIKKELDKRVYRDVLCRALYRLLSGAKKKELPWGILTGVRPIKQVLERMEAKEEVQAIRSFMKKQYYCSDEKINLSISVAEREKKILDKIDYKNGYSIYIGIPFCPTTCAYCSFPSYPLGQFEHLAGTYLEALGKEIKFISDVFLHKKLNTVYIGGGTPTALSSKELLFLTENIRKYLRTKETVEFTVEAGRPDSITKEKLHVLKEQGVNRISINPQSMRQETLELIGRGHTPAQTETAFYLAREMGFNNINMDMIIGLSKEVPKDVVYTLEKIRTLSPDALTVHTLALKRAARLNTDRGLYEGMKAKGIEEMLSLTESFAKEEGYKPYYLYRQKNMEGNLENVGYSREGKEGIYNILIMEEKQNILALGAGGSSKFVFSGNNRIERVENVKSLMDYIGRIDEMIERKRRFLDIHYDKL